MNTTKNIGYGIAGIVVLVIVFLFGKSFSGTTMVSQYAGSSAVGTTNSTARIATIVMSPTAPGATTTSILNGDANDRVIQAATYACTGVGNVLTAYTGAGLTSLGWVITAATTSTAAPASLGNTNYVFDTTNGIPTTTPALSYLASTTPGLTAANTGNRVWPAGSYLTFSSNATTTAICTVGVPYLAM